MNRQERRTAARQQRKSALKNLMTEVGFTARQQEQVHISEPGELIDFTDINAGYEDFADVCRKLKVNWEDFKSIPGEVHVILQLTKSAPPPPQLAMSFPPSLVNENGSPLNEFSIFGGFYTGIEGVLQMLQSQLPSHIELCVPVLRYVRGRFIIVVCPK